MLSLSCKCLVKLMCFVAFGQAAFGGIRSSGEAQQQGKQIYRKGDDGSQAEIFARVSNLEEKLSAQNFPCANCHGIGGEGNKEGGVLAPNITWNVLNSPNQNSYSNRKRIGYDAATLSRALTRGVDSSGNKLNPVMPMYQMSASQYEALTEYLKILGTAKDVETGTTSASISIGVRLPISAQKDVTDDIQATLKNYFAIVNSKGGIFGRSINLIVNPSASESVFANVASFISADENAATFANAQTPTIGPVALTPRLSLLPNARVYYLIPSFYDQARSLSEYFDASHPQLRAGKIAILSSQNPLHQDAVAGCKKQSALLGQTIVSEESWERGAAPLAKISDSLKATQPDAIFLFTGATEFAQIASALTDLKPETEIYSMTSMVGRNVFDLTPSLISRLRLASPSNQKLSQEFLSFNQKMPMPARNISVKSVAYAGAQIVVEALKASGRQLTQEAFINAIERLREFQTGSLPPVTFSINQRIGARGAYIVRGDANTKSFQMMTERIIPRELPSAKTGER